jgi:Domain of unknown function (DUF4134)
MKKKKGNVFKMNEKLVSVGRMLSLMITAICVAVYNGAAQTGVAGGIGAATTQVKSAYAYVGPLILAIGGVVGLAGGIRIYIKWNNGDNDVQKELIGWAGACIFLVLVGTIITAFFG